MSPPTSARAPLFALAVGAFGIGTTEFAPMGLLSTIARDLRVPIPTAGMLITAYALGVLAGAPLVTFAGRHVRRHVLLVAMMGIFTLGNALAALSSSYAMLVAARVLTRWRTARSSASARWWRRASCRRTAGAARSPPCSWA